MFCLPNCFFGWGLSGFGGFDLWSADELFLVMAVAATDKLKWGFVVVTALRSSLLVDINDDIVFSDQDSSMTDTVHIDQAF